jgi:hypothetical protein
MITPFEHIEILESNQFDENTISLSIAKNQTPKVLLIRGLIGSLKYRNTFTQKEFAQTIDYFDLQNSNSAKPAITRLREYISPDIDDELLGKIFQNKKFLYQNLQFFERLNNEFCNYYYYQSKESYTTAFAFIYRILETISYAFPLIYASKTDDFKGTYHFLKQCLTGDKEKGELGFFKSFIAVVFDKDPLKDSSITIEINHESEEIQQYLFTAFKKACPDENIFSPDTNEPDRLSVKFSEYSSFIICLRNRFFHLFNSGHPNLQSDDIMDADSFFELVNAKSIYWISLVVLEILKHNIDKVDIEKAS